MLELIQAAVAVNTPLETWVSKIPTLIVAVITVATAIIAVIKAWTMATSKLTDLVERVGDIEEILEVNDGLHEEQAESIHKVTLIVTGPDGTNGLNGRMKDAESKITSNMREISEIRGELRGRHYKDDEK